MYSRVRGKENATGERENNVGYGWYIIPTFDIFFFWRGYRSQLRHSFGKMVVGGYMMIGILLLYHHPLYKMKI